jgi:hypothetical protein
MSKSAGGDGRSLLSLRELARCRSLLAPEEVLLLLATLPAQVDAGIPHQRFTFSINSFAIAWQNPGRLHPAALIHRAKQDVRDWPPFSLCWLEQANEPARNAEQTLDVSDTLLSEGSLEPADSAPTQLSKLIYELLGGAKRYDRHLPPLACLSEEANAVLHAGFRGKFTDCRSFWRVLESTLVEERKKRSPGTIHVDGSELCVPPWLTGSKLQQCSALSLKPVGGAHLPIHLVARSRFRIGRSREFSDLPVRIAGKNGKEDGEASKEISRVHVLCEAAGEGLTLRDGDGSRPSSNGSTLDGAPLSLVVPRELNGRTSDLSLGTSARVKISLRQHSSTSLPSISGGSSRPSDEQLADHPSGIAAVTFHPARESRAMLRREAVWLFSAVGVELSATGLLRWVAPSESPICFLHRFGRFWLVNMHEAEGRLRIEKRVLEPGQIAPLRDGLLLEFGVLSFTTTLLGR